MDSDPAADPTFKLIEVTAKQIVDRISANNSIDHDSGGSYVPDESGMLDNSDNASTRTLKSFTSDKSDNSPDNRRSSIRNEVGGSGGITPPRPISGDNSLIQQLLTSVQNWIIDAHPQKLGKKQRRNSLSLNKGITNDMHWVFSIESYMRTLDWSSQTVLGQKFSAQLVLWFKHLFHFKSYPESENEYNSVYPHWDAAAGVASMVQFVLLLKFPLLLPKGYAYFADERTYPVIYCSDEYLAHQIRFKLSLPNDSVKVIETMNVDWVPILENKILSDCQRKLVPVMVLLNIDVQSLEAGCRLAEKYKLWIHLYGANTMSYFCKRPETDQIGHSFTVDLTRWLRSPAVPFLTLYKRQNTGPTQLGLCGLDSSDLLTFAPWFLTQAVGWTRFLLLVDELVERGQFVLKMIQKFRCLTLVPNWSTLSDGHQVVSVLTFRYKPVQEKHENEQNFANPSEPDHPSQQYVDTLNSWLYHIMERDLKDYLPVEFAFIEGYGWNIFIDLFKTKKLSHDDKENITNIFENHLTVLQATVSQKLVFSRLAKAAPELDWIDHEKLWAGLGAVRYIPKFARLPESTGANQSQDQRNTNAGSSEKSPVQKTMQAASLEIKDNVDHLNAKIVDKLKAIDTAFSLGESINGEWCVQFGMVTLETDVAELVRLVISAGEEIEESAEFLKRMSELVLQGIQKAEKELRQESEEALWEEGILRRVPVVGSFVNWWSPPVKETGVRGRALNLVQGKVESTENIYKYHMQVEAFSSATTSSNTNTTLPNKQN